VSNRQRIGLMRQRLVLERVTSTTSRPLGEKQPNFTAVGTFFAEVVPMGGDEIVSGSQVRPTSFYRIKMRQEVVISSADRFRFEGTQRYLAIKNINRVMERNAYYEIIASEIPGERA
jgi:head-tail adaptor